MDETTLQKILSQIRNAEDRISRLEKNVPPQSRWDNIDKSEPVHFQLAETVTGVVGLKETIISKHRAVKYSWALLFFFGVGSTIYFTYKTTNEYLAEPTATKIKLNVSAAYDIPAIALCPSAWMDVEKALSMGITLEGLKYSLGYVDSWTDLRLENLTRAKEDFLAFYSANNFSSFLDYLKAIAIDLPTVKSSKEFKNLSTAIKLSDNQSTFFGTVFNNYEICYAYLFAPTDRSLYTTNGASVKYYDKTLGLVDMSPGVWMQLISDLDFLSDQIPPIYLPSYTKNKILITGQHYVMLDKPNARCAKKDTISESYSASACAAECQNEFYREIIDCQLFRYSFVSKSAEPSIYCNFFENLHLNNWHFDEFKSSYYHEQITTACNERCHLKCDRIIYHSFLQWQQKMSKKTYGGIDPAYVNNTKKTLVEIYVEHMAKYEGETVTLEEVSTYSFTELVNNVGGTLGLFVGATLMTFVQLILFFVDYLLIRKETKGEHKDKV